MLQTQVFVGDDPVLSTGRAILGPEDDRLTIVLESLTFMIYVVNDPKAQPITPERRTGNQMHVKINTWQGGDLTFKFKVGFFRGSDMYLAINLDQHYNYNIITYTFSERAR